MPTRDEMFPSKYLKSSDLKGKPVIVKIEAAPAETLKNTKGEEQHKIVLHFAGHGVVSQTSAGGFRGERWQTFEPPAQVIGQNERPPPALNRAKFARLDRSIELGPAGPRSFTSFWNVVGKWSAH
jgi:hypothetical protein